MTKSFSARTFAMAAAAFAVTALWFAARLPAQEQPATAQGKRLVAAEHSNNLRNVDCRKHDLDYPGVTTINVNAADGISADDEAIFVCSGEKLQWVAGTGVKSIEIFFPKAKEWPFKDKFVKKLAGDDQHPTANQVVNDLPADHRMKAYKYRIHIVTTANVKIDLDPHVIPVGP